MACFNIDSDSVSSNDAVSDMDCRSTNLVESSKVNILSKHGLKYDQMNLNQHSDDRIQEKHSPKFNIIPENNSEDRPQHLKVKRKENPSREAITKTEQFEYNRKPKETSSRHQTLLLEIVYPKDISNYELFLRERIGRKIDFVIQQVEVRPNSVEIIVDFPSKTSSRKVTEILHRSNKTQKPKIWIYYHELTKDTSKMKTEVKTNILHDNKHICRSKIDLQSEIHIQGNANKDTSTKYCSKYQHIKMQNNNIKNTPGAAYYNKTDKPCSGAKGIPAQKLLESCLEEKEKHKHVDSKSRYDFKILRPKHKAPKSEDKTEMNPDAVGTDVVNNDRMKYHSQKTKYTVYSSGNKLKEENIHVKKDDFSKLSKDTTKQSVGDKGIKSNEMYLRKTEMQNSSNDEKNPKKHTDQSDTVLTRPYTDCIEQGFVSRKEEKGPEKNAKCNLNENNKNLQKVAKPDAVLTKPVKEKKRYNKIREEKDNESKIKTISSTKNRFKQNQNQNKTVPKSKPQIVIFEIYSYRKGLSAKKFICQRLQNMSVTFNIQMEETLHNITFLSIEFPSSNASKRAMKILKLSDIKYEMKVECYIDTERKLESQQRLRNKKLSELIIRVAEISKDLLDSHYSDICEIKSRVRKLTGTKKRRKFKPIEIFERETKEREANISKLKEMERQDIEFKSFIRMMDAKLKTLKDSDFSASEIADLEAAFEVECDKFVNGLPIYSRREDVIRVVRENQTSVILGETGSGKSTQVVQYVYQSEIFENGLIACIQPRKVAAISLATRVAKEMKTSVGYRVGYQVGMHTKKSNETQILYMTDHILLNECLKDPLLKSYSCIIIDEAHERSIFTDLLLGMIKKCLSFRPDLRVVIMSATIDPEVFVRFFGNTPVLAISGKVFPVEIVWSNENSEDDYEKKTLEKAVEVHETEVEGDMLVFLTSPLEVEKCCKIFEERLSRKNDFVCLPLHGKLQANEQQQVFEPISGGKRKIVFATNSAETSITIPGIKYVVDSGRIKEMKFDQKKNISSLAITLVTKSSADQRSGRAGRTRPGKCFRLYSESEYDKMEKCCIPDILRVNLGQALLKLLELGVDPISFDFVESPPIDMLLTTMQTLGSIDAIKDNRLTELGKWISKLPFDPIYGLFVHNSLLQNVGIEALILTACCGAGNSLFYRPGCSEEQTNADKMKIRFTHEGGDLMTMLNAYREWHQQPEKTKGKWCAENYVNGKIIKSVRDTVNESLSILRKDLETKIEFKLSDPMKIDQLLQKMIFKTFIHNICYYLGHERAGYRVLQKEQNVCLFSSSTLPALGLRPEWIVIEQVLQINRDFGINATPVPGEWIEEGIENGLLDYFEIERTRKLKIKRIAQYQVGEETFREFVGPRYTHLKTLEFDLCNEAEDLSVIIDTNSKTGEIDIYSTTSMTTIVEKCLVNALLPIQKRYKEERSEHFLNSASQGTRVIMSAGCNVVDVLMPEEYKSVIVTIDPNTISSLSVEEVIEELSKYGEIDYVEKFQFTRNIRYWGKVTFQNTEEAEFAVKGSKGAEIVAVPTKNKLQNQHRFRAKIEWCRRKSLGMAYVEFSDERIVGNILQDFDKMLIGGTIADISISLDDARQLCVRNLNRFVNEAVLRHSFVTKFNLHEDDIIRAFVVRERLDTTALEMNAIYHRLYAQLCRYVTVGRFDLYLKSPKRQDFTFLAYASFSKLEEAEKACNHVEEEFRPNHESVSTSVTVQTSMLVTRSVFEHCSSKFIETISDLKEQGDVDIQYKILTNGSCSVDINCNLNDTHHSVRQKLDEIIRGKTMIKREFPNIQELFTRAGKYEIRNVMKQTDTLIIDDQTPKQLQLRSGIRSYTNHCIRLLSLRGALVTLTRNDLSIITKMAKLSSACIT